MKKSIFIWIIAAILVVVAVYTTKAYNANANAGKQNQQVEQVTPTPSQTEDENSEQTGSQPTEKEINLMKDYNFTLEDLQGNKVTLSELKGKKVFLNFWATWCPPCKAEMPDIEKLYQETKDSDLIILAVNVGEDKKTVQDFIKENKYNFPILLDVKGEVSQLYQVSGIPTSYFINAEGYLDGSATGSIPLESMKENINNLD
jgi:thiol-disulfide isomerase/thioredoxin